MGTGTTRGTDIKKIMKHNYQRKPAHRSLQGVLGREF